MKDRIKRQVLIGLVILLIGQMGCVPQSDLQNIVITEDVLYISGEVVRLSGRVLETDGKVDDHGFQISKDEEFSAPIIIALGPKESGLGRFIGEYESLEVNTPYFFRSFVNIDGQEVTGQTKLFSSLIPRIDSFHPTNGVEGNILFIEGANFTKQTRVIIGDTEVDVVDIKDETVIEVRVPALKDVAEVNISVIIQDTTMTFSDKYTYHFGHWQLETVFMDNTQVYECMFFKEGNEFIFGLGRDDRVALNLKIWSLNLDNYTWSDLNFQGTEGTRMPFNSKGFWGAGATIVREAGTNINSPFFWRYNAGIFELKPFVPFLLYKTVGLHLNGELYVFGGEAFDHTPNRTIFHYNEAMNSWDSQDNTQLEISSDYPYFEYNNKAYFFLPDNTVWAYNPLDNSWNSVGNFPNFIKPGGAAVVLNNKVYIGLFDSGGRIWEWDLTTDTWVEKSFFGGSPRDSNVGYFSHNNKVFFFRSKFDGGTFETDPRMELWSLDPTQLK